MLKLTSLTAVLQTILAQDTTTTTTEPEDDHPLPAIPKKDGTSHKLTTYTSGYGETFVETQVDGKDTSLAINLYHDKTQVVSTKCTSSRCKGDRVALSTASPIGSYTYTIFGYADKVGKLDSNQRFKSR